MNRLFSLYLIFCVLLCSTTVVSAKTWVEDFNTASFDSWTKHEHDPENRSTWQPKDGRLDAWIQPQPPPGGFDGFPLAFVGFPIEAEKLNIKVKILEARNASVGIFMGQYDDFGRVINRTIKFLHEPAFGSPIWKPEGFELIQIAKNNNPTPAPLEEIEISFNKGDFEVLTKRKFLVKYHAPELPTINCIGVISIVGLGRGVIAHIVLDDFIISGPTVPAHGTLNVRPKGKAAVLWGELKQQ